MDDAQQAAFQAIGAELIGVIDQVDAAFDEHATFSQKVETRKKVDDLARRYRELKVGMSETDVLQVDRTLGRKVVDLQRVASPLPVLASGRAADKPADSSFFATRAPLSSRQPMTLGALPGAPRAGTGPRYKVTDEIEAWCGPCNHIRTHVIAAMVGEEPAQVVCRACRGSHKYRDTAPEKKKPVKAAAGPYKPTAGEMAAQKKAKERSDLIDQLQAAEHVRDFSPKDRYRAGEILSHPEFGRGKIENVLPRSLLVRFSAGLKTLKLS